MPRYRVRDFLAAFALLALPALTCGVAPVVLDLIQRVQTLEAESDRTFIFVDAVGTLVGDVIELGNGGGEVLIDREGFPLFRLLINRDRIPGNGGRLYFESSDCSGTPFMSQITFPLPLSFVDDLDPSFPVHIPDLAATPISMTSGSARDTDDGCISDVRTDMRVPAIPVFAWGDEFTPRFRVVTRGEFLAMQGP